MVCLFDKRKGARQGMRGAESKMSIGRRGARRSSTVKVAALLTWVLGSAFARVGVAGGETASDVDKASARALGAAGVGLAVAGKCDEAIPKLTAAVKLYHAPTTAEPLGVCLIKVGQVIAGTELLNRLARETLAPNAPPAFVAAQQRASKDYDEGVKKVAKLRVHVTGAAAVKDVQVQVDGVNMDSALLDNDRLIDPGTHSVTATATGFARAQAQVTLREADSQDVSLSLVADPSYQPPPPPGPPSGAPPVVQPPPAPAAPPSRVPAYVAFGVGGVGLAVGSVFGVLALSSKSSLDSACTSAKICPPSSQSNIDSLHSNSIASTIGFGAMVVSAGVGTYLFFSASPPKKESASITMNPWLGPTSVGVSGDFQ